MQLTEPERIQSLLLAAADRLSHDQGSLGQMARPSVAKSSASASVSATHEPYVRSDGAIARLDKKRMAQSSSARRPEISAKAVDKSKISDSTAGPMWFDLPKTTQSPEFMRDLKLLANRNVLDPHRHYKKEGRKAGIPQYSQVGTVIEGPTEFFSGRLTNRERKRTLVEDLVAGEKTAGKFRSKFQQLQHSKASGRLRNKRLKLKHKR